MFTSTGSQPLKSNASRQKYDIVQLKLACGEQTHFSALVSPAEKIAIFSAWVRSPQAKLKQAGTYLGGCWRPSKERLNHPRIETNFNNVTPIISQSGQGILKR